MIFSKILLIIVQIHTIFIEQHLQDIAVPFSDNTIRKSSEIR